MTTWQLLWKSSGQVLKFFDPRLVTTLSVDSSKYGLGAVISQNGYRVEYTSVSLTSTHQKYSQIEKELLVIVSQITGLWFIEEIVERSFS